MAECALGARAAGALHLNEIADARAGLLAALFPDALVTRHNAESVADRLAGLRPAVVVMNPPFSATPGVARIRHDADLRHLRFAFSMLPPGGRLVAITSANCVPGDAEWSAAFASLDDARVAFTMAIDGRAYARRGTGFDTRLTVVDRSRERRPDFDRGARAADAAELLDAVLADVPPRLPVEPAPTADLFGQAPTPRPAPRTTRKPSREPAPKSARDWGEVSELTVETATPEAGPDAPGADSATGPYAPWRPSVVCVPGARRDWTALGGRDEDVIALGKFRQGAEIPLDEGILFATYATLRSPARQGKPSRLDQIVAWLAGSLDEDDRHAFDGVIVFDEAHAMANAAGSKGNRGEVAPSQQGRAGLRLQRALPDARVAYVSATGATTVPGLAYAERLGPAHGLHRRDSLLARPRLRSRRPGPRPHAREARPQGPPGLRRGQRAAHDCLRLRPHRRPLTRRGGSPPRASPASIPPSLMQRAGCPGPPGAALVLTPDASLMQGSRWLLVAAVGCPCPARGTNVHPWHAGYARTILVAPGLTPNK